MSATKFHIHTYTVLNVYFSKLSSPVQYMEVQTNMVLLRSIKDFFSFTRYVDLRHRDMGLSEFRTSGLSTSQTHRTFRFILCSPPNFFLKWLDFVTQISRCHFGSYEDHFSQLAMTAGDYID